MALSVIFNCHYYQNSDYAYFASKTLESSIVMCCYSKEFFMYYAGLRRAEGVYKEKYDCPRLEIFLFQAEDVIRTSKISYEEDELPVETSKP